ncbi:cupredoxin domain-containing protein [Candidatus Micrarchaeota archaeon]|nr:cupredoxin domain-containing protein [Candidatus Micrarchaeota archaeon]
MKKIFLALAFGLLLLGCIGSAQEKTTAAENSNQTGSPTQETADQQGNTPASAPAQTTAMPAATPALTPTVSQAQTETVQTTATPIPAPAPEARIEIKGFAFSPAEIEVKAGTTVVWTNADGAKHTATGDAGDFDTGLLAQGEGGSFKFNEPGTYSYHCTPHPYMKGTIKVT